MFLAKLTGQRLSLKCERYAQTCKQIAHLTMRLPIELQYLMLQTDPVKSLETMSILRLVCKSWRDHLTCPWQQELIRLQLETFIERTREESSGFFSSVCHFRLPIRKVIYLQMKFRPGDCTLVVFHFTNINAIDIICIKQFELIAMKKQYKLEFEAEKASKLAQTLMQEGYLEENISEHTRDLFPDTVWLYKLPHRQFVDKL